ncbi:S1 family peptidase [Rhodobacterales bacterium]|nr:S1 family peptidase [Rhodobacterales bacterium]
MRALIGTARYGRKLTLLAAAASPLATSLIVEPVRAETPALEVIDSTSAPWPSVGRVNVAGFNTRSMCTGTLVAADLVLTAAHCLYNSRTLKPLPLRDLLFIAGVRRDSYAERLEARCFVTLTNFAPSSTPSFGGLRHDAGLIVLKTRSTLPPVPPLSPADEASLEKNAELRSVGYRRSRRLLPSAATCEVLERKSGVWITDCPSESGASGGPLLVETEDGFRVAGIMSAKLDGDRSVIVPYQRWQSLLEKASCADLAPEDDTRQ